MAIVVISRSRNPIRSRVNPARVLGNFLSIESSGGERLLEWKTGYLRMTIKELAIELSPAIDRISSERNTARRYNDLNIYIVELDDS